METPAGTAMHNNPRRVRYRRMHPPRPAVSNRGTVFAKKKMVE